MAGISKKLFSYVFGLTAIKIALVLLGMAVMPAAALASTNTQFQNMVSDDNANFFWYDNVDTLLNLGYDTDLAGFKFWSATTSTPSLQYIYLYQPTTPLNWDYSLTLPTDDAGYAFWLIVDGGSAFDRIFRYYSGGNPLYARCPTINTIILADKTLQLARCGGVAQNPITNIYFSMGVGGINGIYLVVYTDDNLEDLITDEATMYNYLNSLANYNSVFGGQDIDAPLSLPAGTCDDLDVFSGALCRVMVYLFKPSTASLTKFADLQEIIYQKPPFAYWFDVKDALNSFSATTTPAFTLASVPVLNSYIFTPIRTGLIFLFWLLFGVWVIKRVAAFDF